MAEPLYDRASRRIDPAAELYHRLVMIVASAGTGKTVALQDVRAHREAPLVNVTHENFAQLNSNLSLYRKKIMTKIEYTFAQIANHPFVSKHWFEIPSKQTIWSFLEEKIRDVIDE